MFRHVEAAYEAMAADAKKRKIEGRTLKVYEGFTTRLLVSKGIPVAYYTAVTELLKVMGCAVQLSRGSGKGNPSKWAIVGPPTPEGYDRAVKVISPVANGKRPTAAASLTARKRALREELKAVDRELKRATR
jgi:hypothetical protein